MVKGSQVRSRSLYLVLPGSSVCQTRAIGGGKDNLNLNFERPAGVDEAMRHYVSTPVMH